MVLRYTVIDPTKNITLLVTTPVQRSLQPALAAWLLQRERDAEQVGFLEPSDYAPARLQMMGGEFCGNATMSLGAWLCRKQQLPAGESREFQLDISGTDALVSCSVTAVRGGYIGTVTLPLPLSVEHRTFPTARGEVTLPIVTFPGICHIVAPIGTVQPHDAETLLRRWSAALPFDAVGLILLDEQRTRIDPLVYVKPTDTAVWERGCGSGSAAVACALTHQRGGSQCLSIKQPGGTIVATTQWNESAVTALTITGTVSLGREKTVDAPF